LFEGFRMACELDARAAGFERVLRAVGSSGAVAKLRAGGVTERAVPDIDAVAAFVWGCARHDVPFKLTAGLHHAVRGVYAFTYDADSPRGVMHGLLNVLMAAMAARRLARSPGATAPSGATPDVPSQIRSILGEDDPGAFEIRADRVAWRSEVFTADEIEAVRAAFVLSVGSCSFDEPLEDVQAMSPA
jgi:hypothetical protein